MDHELFEQLDACDPKWRQRYPTLLAAAREADVVGLYHQYLATPGGRLYLQTTAGVPDYAGAIRAAQESADHLPYRLDNLEQLPDAEDD